jgi:hypothetical protein
MLIPRWKIDNLSHLEGIRTIITSNGPEGLDSYLNITDVTLSEPLSMA